MRIMYIMLNYVRIGSGFVQAGTLLPI